jgi:hypothetical protein
MSKTAARIFALISLVLGLAGVAVVLIYPSVETSWTPTEGTIVETDVFQGRNGANAKYAHGIFKYTVKGQEQRGMFDSEACTADNCADSLRERYKVGAALPVYYQIETVKKDGKTQEIYTSRSSKSDESAMNKLLLVLFSVFILLGGALFTVPAKKT